MRYDWMLSVPAWGEYHVSKFVNYVLPSVVEALGSVRGSVRFLIHTDQPKVIGRHTGQFETKFLPMPPRETVTKKPYKTRYVKLGDAERMSLSEARRGECVGLLYGDTIISREFFSSAERRFDEGYKLTMMQGPRVLGDRRPPIGADARTLSQWAWNNRHSWSDECAWGRGNSKQPAVLYFEKGGSVVVRAFMLYSYAMIKDRPLSFGTLTADQGDGISSQYRENEIHVATSCDEVSCASLTPREHSLGVGADLSVDSVVEWGRSRTVKRNLWMFGHRCQMVGDQMVEELPDVKVCDEILRRLR